MATVAGSARAERGAQWRQDLRKGAKRSGTLLGGATLILVALLLLTAWRPTARPIPSLNTAAAGPVENWLGAPGALLPTCC
jgi:S-DNA-T family DNA segregation ATPase FtsK/SpoIIIE